VPPAALAAAVMAGYSVCFHRGHRRRVGLLGPVQRALSGEAEVVQGAPDAGHREVRSEAGGDQLPDDLPGPQRHREPVIAGIGVDDQRGQLTQLDVRQLAPDRHRLGAQRLPVLTALLASQV
jgi:hypothetical protein